MSSFTRSLIGEKLKGKLWKVVEEFTYYIGEEESKEFVTIHKDFITDLASVPWFARWIISRDGTHTQAAVLHDFIYKYQLFSRKKCDDIFLEAMEILMVSMRKRLVIYKAVRLFGWYGYWKAGRKLKKEKSHGLK